MIRLASAMVVSDQGRDWCWVFWPQRGPYANTTYFVTDDAALDQLECEAGTRRVRDIALFTDGIEPLVLDYRARAAHTPFFDRMIQPLRASTTLDDAAPADAGLSHALARYLASPVITERTDDDTTLILATRRLCVAENADAGLAGMETVVGAG